MCCWNPTQAAISGMGMVFICIWLAVIRVVRLLWHGTGLGWSQPLAMISRLTLPRHTGWVLVWIKLLDTWCQPVESRGGTRKGNEWQNVDLPCLSWDWHLLAGTWLVTDWLFHFFENQQTSPKYWPIRIGCSSPWPNRLTTSIIGLTLQYSKHYVNRMVTAGSRVFLEQEKH